MLLWTIFLCLFLIGSRFATIFPVLYTCGRAIASACCPTINLCQMSELSLVLLALGKASGDVSENTIGIAAFAFAFLAVGSTYAILQSDALLREAVPWLNKMDLQDLDQTVFIAAGGEKSQAHLPAGFFVDGQLAGRGNPAGTAGVDFGNDRGGFQPARPSNACVSAASAPFMATSRSATCCCTPASANAEIIICSLPNTVLRGANNLKMLRQIRELNPTAHIIVHAELLSDIPALYAAGASYVSAPRLLEAADLLHAIDAAEKKLLEEKRAAQLGQLEARTEVIP